MKYTGADHTFAVCAYKESPYLEDCVKSLLAQSVKSNVIIATSTDNDYIRGVAEKYELPYYVNDGESGITQDWNFAYRCTETELMTIAHQDDTYGENYVKEVLRNLSEAKTPLIAFTDYGEIRGEEIVLKNTLLQIKRLMLFPLRWKLLQNSRFIRRRILSLGCPICCPSVTFVKDNLPPKVFKAGFRSDEDWEAWEMLSRMDGAFVYCSEPLMFHRIHGGSETSAIIGETGRGHEDYQMFQKFWPKPITKILVKLYSLSEKSNKLENK